MNKKANQQRLVSEVRNITNYMIWLVLLLTILFVVFVRANFLDMPLERDEGEYYYLAQLILDGKTPYIDFQLRKPPLLFYTYALINFIFGNSLSGMHIGFLFLNIFTIILLYFVIKKIINAYTGLITASSYAFLSLSPHAAGFTTQAEHIIVFYTFIGLLFLVQAFESKKSIHYFLAGGGLCMAFLVKQNAVFFVVFGGFAILIHVFHNKPIIIRSLFKNLTYYSTGIFFILCIIAFIIFLQGAIHEMYYWTITAATKYVSRVSFAQGVEYFQNSLVNVTDQYLFFWICAVLGLPALLFSKTTWFTKLLLLSFTFFSFLTIVPGYLFFGHYWILLLPAISILIGILFNLAREFANKYTRPRFATMATLIVFLFAYMLNIGGNFDYYFQPDHIKILRNVYGMNPFPESKVIGDFIKNNSDEGDKIAVLGSEPQIYFYSNRRCPSKYHFIEYLMQDVNKFPKSRKFQQEFILDITKSRPRYIVFFKHPLSWLRRKNSDSTIFQWFAQFSEKYYTHVGSADILLPDRTNYVWGEDLKVYKSKGDYLIKVYEREAL